MELDLRQLEVFCKVVELQSISKACDAVHLTQASASERVSNLEGQVGGRLLYRLALPLLKLRRDVALEMQDFLGVRKGTLLVAASTVPGEYVLPGVVARFRRKCPEVSVEVAVGDSDEVLRGVREGEAEVGFVGSAGRVAGLKLEDVWKDELVVVVPAGHRLAGRRSAGLAEVCREPFVAREAGSGTRQVIEARLERRMPRGEGLKVVAVLGTSTAVLEGVRGGLGISVLSSRVVAADVKAGRVSSLRIRGMPMPRMIRMATDPRRAMSPLCRAFVEFVQEEEGGRR